MRRMPGGQVLGSNWRRTIGMHALQRSVTHETLMWVLSLIVPSQVGNMPHTRKAGIALIVRFACLSQERSLSLTSSINL